MPDLPPPGPERDRLVAEALGCTTWDIAWFGCNCAIPPSETITGPHNVAIDSSTSNYAGLDALEAAVEGGVIAGYEIARPSKSSGFRVEVDPFNQFEYVNTVAPTLGDAASRAIIEAKRREG